MFFNKAKQKTNVEETVKINTTETESTNVEDTPVEVDTKMAKNTGVVTEQVKKDVVKDRNGKEMTFSKYAGIDFSKWDTAKLVSIIVECFRENKLLFQENEKLNEEAIQAVTDIQTSHKNIGEVNDKVLYLAQSICPELVARINEGKKFTLDAEIAFIKDYVLQERKRLSDLILKLKNTVLDNKIMLNELKEQLADKTIHANEAAIANDTPKEFTAKDFEEYAGSSAVQNSEAVSINGSILIKPINLNASRESIDDTGKKIMEGIGKEGLSEYPELLKYCLDANIGITESKFETSIDNLRNASVVDVDVIQSFNRIRGVRLISLSNEVGKTLYKEIFRERPVVSEKEKIKRENDNLNHGYSIKDVVGQLKQFGYEEVSMDRASNTISISGAVTWIPDVIAINPLSGKKEYFEVEMGNHTTENFNAKLDKANLKATILKIIVPNKKVQELICGKIKNWKAENPKKTKAITIFVQRFSEFKNKEDGNVFTPREEVKIEDFKNATNESKNNAPSNNSNNKPISVNRNNDNRNNNNAKEVQAQKPVVKASTDLEDDV